MLNEYQVSDPKKAGKKILLLGLLLALLLLITIIIFYFTKINQAASTVSVPTTITIERGSSTQEIATKLENENIINSPWAFILYVKITGAGASIKAGNYTLDPKMSIVEVVDILTAGKVTPDEKKITIIEGWTNKEISSYLEKRGVAENGEFDIALKQEYNFNFKDEALKFGYQGFLFPDTYHISKDGKSSELVQKMLDNFETKFTDQMLNDMVSRNLKLEDIVILASIIEKEVGRNGNNLSLDDFEAMEEERKIVAGVFYNRLRIGMPLQSDATVNYVTGKNDRQATFDDIKVKSPYNTYVNVGLPPGPISNPGIESIKAAINPTETDYIYFLNKENGEAVFSKTLEEHNRNKAKYLD